MYHGNEVEIYEEIFDVNMPLLDNRIAKICEQKADTLVYGSKGGTHVKKNGANRERSTIATDQALRAAPPGAHATAREQGGLVPHVPSLTIKTSRER